MNTLFDENNAVWIKIYKIFVILSAIAILIVGFFWGKSEATSYSHYSKYFDFWEFMLYFAIAFAAAGIEFVFGMVVVNFLNNVQVIRENVQLISKKLEEKRESEKPQPVRAATPTVQTATGSFNLSDYI